MKSIVVAEIPVIKGLNGCFSGIHNDVMLIAGGTNFPDKKLWEGGNKKWYNTIFALKKRNLELTYEWSANQTSQLPEPLANGASVSTKLGVLCIGGENGKVVVNTVFLMEWDKSVRQVCLKEMPFLPVPLCNLSACEINDVVYVVGGQTTIGGEATDYIFSLDLNADPRSQKWESLEGFPGQGRIQAVISGHKKGSCSYLYVMSGTYYNTMLCPSTKMLSDVYEYNITNSKWTQKQDIPNNDTPLISNGFIAAAPVLSIGKANILIFGGAGGENQPLAIRLELEHQIKEIKSGRAANQANVLEKIKTMEKECMSLLRETTFSRILWSYNSIEDSWTKLATLPKNPQIVTNALFWDNAIFIPGGEISPGVRTAGILKLSLNNIVLGKGFKI
ncbi:hypothetical protein [Arenibacter troitsensis]|uniref:Cyclically-permuted mutarotase family protein n=1 Tax=Arenibacter troitsensis TaxID=188872 RepID=A0A1X7IH64_9FLAO|nr:hypothetical protein [Arenibacter troitsensis]SMG13636.1 cyclically-permuted mutarotase family protein [Arenibacter troitsensis]